MTNSFPGPVARRSLLAGALSSAAVAALHVGVIFGGPSAYAFFGAPDLGVAEARGSMVPDLITAALVIGFLVCAYYALVGAGVTHRSPPLLDAGLIVIGAIYSLRGLAVLPDLMRLARDGAPARNLVFSAVSLGIGACYLAGSWARRRGFARVRSQYGRPHR